MRKYKLYCETDSKFETVIASADPTVCPTDAGHAIRTNSISIIETEVLINDGTPTELSLDDYKELRYNEIDGKTIFLISQGFAFDGKVFSLSQNAQINWTNIRANEADFAFPLGLTTIDNDTYSIEQVDVASFYNAGKDIVKGHLDSGRDLKKLIFDAADEAAVDAVVDNR